MIRHLVFSDNAEDDLRAINYYIAARGGRATADAFYQAITDYCERLASLPGILGTARPDLGPALRSTPYRKYILYFRYIADTLEIVAILHASRDALMYFGNDDSAEE